LAFSLRIIVLFVKFTLDIDSALNPSRLAANSLFERLKLQGLKLTVSHCVCFIEAI